MLIHHSTLKACLHGASTDETRYNLNGVCIEPSGRVVATDGHMLITVKRPADADADYPALEGEAPNADALSAPIILGTASVDRAIKAATRASKGRRHMPILQNVHLDAKETNANGHARMSVTDLETVERIDAKKIEGEFPSWRQVVPKQPASFTIDLNLDLLCRVAKAVHAAGSERNAIVTLRFTDALGPVRIEKVIDGAEFLAVVMPARRDEPSKPLAIESLT